MDRDGEMKVTALAAMKPLGQLTGTQENGAQENDAPIARMRPKPLSRRQKAAIVVRLLASEGLKLPLAELSDEHQTSLAEEIAHLRLIDRETLVSVVEEFCTELEQVGLVFAGGLDGALSLLDGQLSPDTSGRLRRLASSTSRSDPWERIAGLSTEMLLPVLQQESAEVAAVVLSKLSVAKAAELLGNFPGDKARRVAYAVSLTGNVAPVTVDRIGHALATQIDATPAKAFDTGPVERVGAILNVSASVTRNAVLKGLEDEDEMFAEQVKRAIFTFANIPRRIDPRDLPKILRNIEQPRLAIALAGAKGELEATAEFILTNMSQRMAQTLRDEMGEMGQLKERDVEDAMNELVATIREMESAGEIFLVADDEE